MSNFAVCRVCLASDLKTYTLNSVHYRDILEKLTNQKINTYDGRPKTVCYICYSLLKRCLQFANMSKISEEILTEILHDNAEITEQVLAIYTVGIKNKFYITPVETFNIPTNESTSKHNVSEHIIVEFSEVILKKEDGIEEEAMVVSEQEIELGQVKEEELNVCEDKEDTNDLEKVISGIAQNIEKDIAVKQEHTESLLSIEEPITCEMPDECKHLDKRLLKDNEQVILKGKQRRNKQLVLELKQELEVGLNNIDNECVEGEGDDFGDCILIESGDEEKITEQSILIEDDEEINEIPYHTGSSIIIEDEEEHMPIQVSTSHQCQSNRVNNTSNFKSHIKKNWKRKESVKKKSKTALNQIFVYSCQLCKEFFFSIDDMNIHLKTAHNIDEIFKCAICDLVFINKSGLWTHYKDHYQEVFICDLCGNIFPRKSKLLWHLKNWHRKVYL